MQAKHKITKALHPVIAEWPELDGPNCWPRGRCSHYRLGSRPRSNGHPCSSGGAALVHGPDAPQPGGIDRRALWHLHTVPHEAPSWALLAGEVHISLPAGAAAGAGNSQPLHLRGVLLLLPLALVLSAGRAEQLEEPGRVRGRGAAPAALPQPCN